MKNLFLGLGIIALGLLLFVLFLGLIMPSQPVISGEILSDNWFHYGHPYWAGALAIALYLILAPPKYIFFWRKKTKA